jgi:hypothetical protein
MYRNRKCAIFALNRAMEPMFETQGLVISKAFLARFMAGVLE